jgi:hypothetical protein
MTFGAGPWIRPRGGRRPTQQSQPGVTSKLAHFRPLAEREKGFEPSTSTLARSPGAFLPVTSREVTEENCAWAFQDVPSRDAEVVCKWCASAGPDGSS